MKHIYTITMLAVILGCVGCLENPFSGTSEVGAPDSIIGYKFLGTITD